MSYREKTPDGVTKIIGGQPPGGGGTGPAGPPGKSIMDGSGAPAGSLGAVGDLYINYVNGDLYEKTASTTWTLDGNIRGPQGIQGIQGPVGPSTGAAGGALTGTYPNPGIAAPIVLPQVATPAAASAGQNKFYFKADNRPYFMSPDGVERPFIQIPPSAHLNPDFEFTTTNTPTGIMPTNWYAYWTSVAATRVTWSVDTSVVVEGMQSLKGVMPSGALGRIGTSVFSVLPGQIVTFSIWCKTNITGPNLGITLLTDPTNPDFFISTMIQQTNTVATGTTMKKYTVSFRVPEGHYAARVDVNPSHTAAFTYWLDTSFSDVSTTTQSSGVEIGSIQLYGGTFASIPNTYRGCTGAALSRTDYAELFAVLGTAFGAGDGSTTFNIPNLIDAFPLGAGNRSRGTTGGSETKTIDAANLPKHTHGVLRGTGTGSAANRVLQSNTTAASGTSTEDGGFANTPLNIMPPWLAIQYIIKVK